MAERTECGGSSSELQNNQETGENSLVDPRGTDYLFVVDTSLSTLASYNRLPKEQKAAVKDALAREIRAFGDEIDYRWTSPDYVAIELVEKFGEGPRLDQLRELLESYGVNQKRIALFTEQGLLETFGYLRANKPRSEAELRERSARRALIPEGAQRRFTRHSGVHHL